MTSAASVRVIAPGGTIGILGGGQLGRMTTLAAARLGYRTHVFCQRADEPGAQIASARTLAPFTDEAALAAFAAAVDVVTFEFENIPVETLIALAKRTPVRPSPTVLAISQDRLVEKEFLAGSGFLTAPFAEVEDDAQLAAADARIGRPSILKTSRHGYDGKGQVRLALGDDAGAAWRTLGRAPAVLEGFVRFSTEASVIVARGLDGKTVAFDVTENRHEGGILRESRVPAQLLPALMAEAQELASRIAITLDLTGLLAVELFVNRDGGLLVNELAPRPHNSGHWTIDAAATSQFEQLVRAICGLPLGSAARTADARMLNLLGEEAQDWRSHLADPGARLHLYGKDEARPGRKMGHVTWVSPLPKG
ncbi:MAG: 5-(carboxyamino)imidazole ribonucleotide synthase [Alphaproteobacteria bacterium]|nr:5-(carboxyamino)imidazole ribonucleotide synthase [Alphaproteobacteria bacterium]